MNPLVVNCMSWHKEGFHLSTCTRVETWVFVNEDREYRGWGNTIRWKTYITGSSFGKCLFVMKKHVKRQACPMTQTPRQEAATEKQISFEPWTSPKMLRLKNTATVQTPSICSLSLKNIRINMDFPGESPREERCASPLLCIWDLVTLNMREQPADLIWLTMSLLF